MVLLLLIPDGCEGSTERRVEVQQSTWEEGGEGGTGRGLEGCCGKAPKVVASAPCKLAAPAGALGQQQGSTFAAAHDSAFIRASRRKHPRNKLRLVKLLPSAPTHLIPGSAPGRPSAAATARAGGQRRAA